MRRKKKPNVRTWGNTFPKQSQGHHGMLALPISLWPAFETSASFLMILDFDLILCRSPNTAFESCLSSLETILKIRDT